MTSLPNMDQISSSFFPYQPLDEPGSIRLLILQPGLPEEEIHCSLVHTTLAKCYQDIYDRYTALSYVWGNPKDTMTILLNSSPFQVTTNLASALRDLRDEQRPLRVWADAICINQHNVPERNSQVRLMKDIYTLANQTVAYLGDSNDEIIQAFEVLQTNQVEDLISTSGPNLQASPINKPRDNEALICLQKAVAIQILSRPWFDRVWIYQELVLSKIVWVQCGRSRVDWDYLVRIIPEVFTSTHRYPSPKTISDDNRASNPMSQRFELVSHMNKARQKFKESVILKQNPASLLEILLARRGFAATDQRDMIYGHMAVSRLHDLKRHTLPLSFEELMANYQENSDQINRIISDPISDFHYADYLTASKGFQPCSPIPIVDYRKPICEVFTEATRFIMDFDQSIHTLLHAGAIQPTRRREDLPSWVPDWSLNSSNYPIPLHSCSTSLKPPPMVTFAFCNTASVFASLGIIRGTLSEVSHIIEAYDKDLDKEEEFHAISRKTVIDSGGSCKGQDDSRLEELYLQLYNIWCDKLGGVCLPPYQSSSICTEIWNAFNWVNHKKLLESAPSLIKWSLLKPGQDCDLRDISLEGLLMRHPFSIFPSKILTGRRVAIYNDSFFDGWCVVPASSQPGDILCYLRDPLYPLVVLRPVPEPQVQDMNKIITENWKESHPLWFGKNGLESQGLNPRHFTFIGEAWIQKPLPNIMRLQRDRFVDTLIVIH